jgi:hypothetical protein
MMSECVRCGYCCTVASCGFGEWNPTLGQCRFLTGDNLCGKHEEIFVMEGSDVSPAFGKGCPSSLFNERRDAKIRGDWPKTSQGKDIDMSLEFVGRFLRFPDVNEDFEFGGYAYVYKGNRVWERKKG